MRRGSIEVVSFDFDGTLVNTSTAMEEATTILIRNISLISGINYSQLYRSYTSISEELSKKGNYSRHVWIKETLKHFNVIVRNSEITRFVKEYWEYITENSSPYDEVMEVLAYLKKKGYAIAILTNTDGLYGVKMKRILKIFPKNLFDYIVIAGEDTSKPKPHVEAFYKLTREANVYPEKVIHVGDDYLADIVGCFKAGLKCVLVDREDKIRSFKNTVIIGDLKKLLKFL